MSLLLEPVLLSRPGRHARPAAPRMAIGLAATVLTVIATAAAVLASSAAFAPARADIIAPFWEEKPDITGHRPRAAKKLRTPVEESNGATFAKRDRAKGKRYAALGDAGYDPRPSPRSLTGAVSWSVSSSCLNGTLQAVVQEIAAGFGRVTVTSTCRSRGHNASVGGAKRSHHLTGDAVDFRVHGNVSGALAYLQQHGAVGGIKHYGGGLIHADTGPRRSW